MKFGGYEVWVLCDGKPLSEYCTQSEGNDGKTVTCFIPSESGKAFSIHWRDHVRTSFLRYLTTIDGRQAGGNRCPPGGKGKREGVRIDSTRRRLLQFSPLRLIEEETFGMSSEAGLGEIQVTVSRIRAEHRNSTRTFEEFRPVGAVHEKSKKAGVHCVSLGEERKTKPNNTFSVSTPLVHGEGHVAKFIFRYRSLDLLQAQGIVPLQPSTDRHRSAASQNRKRPSRSEGDNIDLRHKRARRHRSRDEVDMDDVDGVVVSSDEDCKVKIKSEAGETRKRRSKMMRRSSGRIKKEMNEDVIDLTLSD